MYSSNEDQYESDLCWTLNSLQTEKLFANKTNCEFGRDKVDYLGYLIKSGKVSMDPNKTEEVQSWPVPTSVKEAKFLGLVKYYNCII